MKAIIFPPSNNGEGAYYLIAEDGEMLCGHYCSGRGYAPGDLYEYRPERKKMFDEKGITEFVWLEESGFSREELIERNKAWAEANKQESEE